MRRKLSHLIHEPIKQLSNSIEYDTLKFIEKDGEAASRTRAAALMYIMRNNLDLTTHVSENVVYVLQNKDVMENVWEIDIR